MVGPAPTMVFPVNDNPPATKVLPVIAPVALTAPPVSTLPAVALPVTDTTVPNKLEPVMVPVALTAPTVTILAPVILPAVTVPVVLIAFEPNAAKNVATLESE